MPAPALSHLISNDKGHTVCNVSVAFDASVFKVWRDSTEFGVSDPKYPYWAMDLHVASWPTFSSTLLARYSGGKLVKGALYQLRGRFFVTTSRFGQESYLHIDEAIRFQGPGTIRSIKQPSFFMVGEVLSASDTDLVVSWVTKDTYRRNSIYEQNAIISIDSPLPQVQGFVNQLCIMEGRMESSDHNRGWVCTGISQY